MVRRGGRKPRSERRFATSAQLADAVRAGGLRDLPAAVSTAGGGRGIGYGDRCRAQVSSWPRLDPSARDGPCAGEFRAPGPQDDRLWCTKNLGAPASGVYHLSHAVGGRGGRVSARTGEGPARPRPRLGEPLPRPAFGVSSGPIDPPDPDWAKARESESPGPSWPAWPGRIRTAAGPRRRAGRRWRWRRRTGSRPPAAAPAAASPPSRLPAPAIPTRRTGSG